MKGRHGGWRVGSWEFDGELFGWMRSWQAATLGKLFDDKLDDRNNMPDAMDIDTESAQGGGGGGGGGGGSATTHIAVTHTAAEANGTTANALSQAFMSWLSSRPGVTINPSISLIDLSSRNAGRGVFSTAPLSPDTPLFTIPYSSTLSVFTSPLTTTHIPSVMQRLNSQNPWMALVLALIYETRPDSEWKPYIDLLPREFDTLMFWTEQELEGLRGCAVVEKIGKAEAEEGFRDFLVPVVGENKELFKNTDVQFDTESTGELKEESLIQAAHRMASCIMSYSFDIENQKGSPEFPPPLTTASSAEELSDSDDEEAQHYKAMVPLADMLNADADENNVPSPQHMQYHQN